MLQYSAKKKKKREDPFSSSDLSGIEELEEPDKRF
jgi:hypothetical protein